MKFKEDRIPDFLRNFESIEDKIRKFPGCLFLELYQDKKDPRIFFTYSHWDLEDSLNTYRGSDMFKGVWKETKSMFAEPAKAWSLESVSGPKPKTVTAE